MAQQKRIFSYTFLIRTLLFILIIFTILSYVYDNVFIVTHLTDDNLNENKAMQIKLIQQPSHPYKHSPHMHAIPSLIIIGPPKSGTTSLITNLANYFPNWHQQIPRKENGHWYGHIRMHIVRNQTLYDILMHKLNTEIKNESHIQISHYSFDHLLSEQIWSETDILSTKTQYIHKILTNLTHITPLKHGTIIMEKTPFNYYLPLLVPVFRNYFSAQLLSHIIGTKLVAILRDPSQRLISWHSMKVKFLPSRQSMDYFILNQSGVEYEFVMAFRDLIINRKTESDDTLIMLKYMEWIYKTGRERKGPWANIWLTEYMLMNGMDYPVLLMWIYAYRQKGLGEYFRVIGFNYMVSNFEQVMRWLRCWVEQGICDYRECDENVEYLDLNESIVLGHMNKYGRKKSEAVLEYMRWFYEPLKQKTVELVKRTESMLGVWDDSHVRTSW